MVRQLLSVLLAFGVSLVTACASTPPLNPIMAAHCGPTPINEKDIQRFGFEPEPGKIVVFRIFATWCPFCKNDLTKLGEQFKRGAWHADRVSIFLLAYRNHDEDAESFATFKKEKLASYGIPAEALQIKYVDKDFAELNQSQNDRHEVLFTGWRGIPFGMVFGSDGRLAYRGQFTNSESAESTHYRFITELQDEHCLP